jgi:UDP:flavonoid glycosyltransferase YjiC (YdhE family)
MLRPNPMLALALELTPRGHVVVVVMFTVADGARRLAGLRFTGAPISARSR